MWISNCICKWEHRLCVSYVYRKFLGMGLFIQHLMGRVMGTGGAYQLGQVARWDRAR